MWKHGEILVMPHVRNDHRKCFPKTYLWWPIFLIYFLSPIKMGKSWHVAHNFCTLSESYLTRSQLQSRENCMVQIVVEVLSWVSGESQQVQLQGDSPLLDIDIYMMNHPSKLLSIPPSADYSTSITNLNQPWASYMATAGWCGSIPKIHTELQKGA